MKVKPIPMMKPVKPAPLSELPPIPTQNLIYLMIKI
jgi:hypothetical protein